MLRIFVDSGSSIKQDEKDLYGVEILPLRICLGDREYDDGVDLSMEDFYHALIDKGEFPKTSLPSLGEAQARVETYLEAGDEVLIIAISSGISGTYNTLRMLFCDQPSVVVVDSKTAVGGVRILVEEANKYRHLPVHEVAKKLYALIPRMRVIAIPETLDYLHKGGRLSASARVVGNLLQIKPLISLDATDGGVKVLQKVRGMKFAMEALVRCLDDMHCDMGYPIVPSYTYNSANLDRLIAMTPEKYHPQMTAYDNLDPAIACHWGPNAFGYIFVGG